MSEQIVDSYPFYFDPMFFDPIVLWEHDMVAVLSNERNREELEWLVRMLTICEP